MATHTTRVDRVDAATTLAGDLARDPGARFGFATLALVVALSIVGLVGASPATATACAVIVAGMASFHLPQVWRLWIALVGWAFVTGFFVNEHGALTFHDNDLIRLAVLLVVAPALAGRTHAIRSSFGA